MSVSENSTLFPLRDNEGSELALDNQPKVGDLDLNSPEKSPYTDGDFVIIIVGSTRFYAHRTILAKSPELQLKPFSKLWGDKANETVTFPNIDEHTAHTLINYLYTEKYGTLELQDKDEADITAAGYKLGTCVYCTAIKYRLPGLAELAQEKIVAYGKGMDILNIVKVAREHAFPLLPDDETWFPEYLEDRIRVAYTQDPTLLASLASLMGGTKEADNKFRTVVMSAIAAPQPTQISQPDGEDSTPLTKEKAEAVSEDGNDFSEKHGAEEPEVTDQIIAEEISEPQEVVVEVDPVEAVPVDSQVEVEDLKLEEINPTQSPLAQPEPYTDEVGFGASKHYKSQNKKPENIVEQEDLESEIQHPTHSRTDSVLQDTEPVDLKQLSTVQATAIASPDAAEEKNEEKVPVIVDGTNGAAVPKKKKRKGKKANAGTPTAAGT